WWRRRHCSSRLTGAGAGWNGRRPPCRGRPENGTPRVRSTTRSTCSNTTAAGAPVSSPIWVFAVPTRAEWPCTRRVADDTRSLWTIPRSSSPTWSLPRCPHMPTDNRPVTIPDFLAWKSQKRRISVLTAYDYPTARLLDGAGVDCLLVGDSLGTVVQGWETTLRVTLDQVIYHAEMVARAARRALVVADLPFISCQVSPRQAIRPAGRILKET